MSGTQYYLDYLKKYNFEKQLKKLNKKLAGKKVVLYGAGVFFGILSANYDLSGLNIVAIADKRFEDDISGEFLGYKTCAPKNIEELNPDVVLVSTLEFVNLMDFLLCELLVDTKIKVKPLVKLPFFKLIKEIWNS